MSKSSHCFRNTLLFLIFINDLPLVLSKNGLAIDLYADDTTIYDIQSDLETLRSNLQDSLLILQDGAGKMECY